MGLEKIINTFPKFILPFINVVPFLVGGHLVTYPYREEFV